MLLWPLSRKSCLLCRLCYTWCPLIFIFSENTKTQCLSLRLPPCVWLWSDVLLSLSFFLCEKYNLMKLLCVDYIKYVNRIKTDSCMLNMSVMIMSICLTWKIYRHTVTQLFANKPCLTETMFTALFSLCASKIFTWTSAHVLLGNKFSVEPWLQSSILTGNIVNWHGSCMNQNRRGLWRVIKTTHNIISTNLLRISGISEVVVVKKTNTQAKAWAPSWKRYRSICRHPVRPRSMAVVC